MRMNYQTGLSVSAYTIAGLAIAFLGGPIVIAIFQAIEPEILSNAFVAKREVSLFFLAGLMIAIIFKGEKLGLDSIGIHNRYWGKSILWCFISIVFFVASILVCLYIFKIIEIPYGQGGDKYKNVSLWVVSLMMLRAGVVEEIFYRGYLIERLASIYNHRFFFLFLPSVVFALSHYRQGFGGIIVAFVGGMVMALSYLRTRDLKANMLAHFIIDFIPNVVVPLVTGE